MGTLIHAGLEGRLLGKTAAEYIQYTIDEEQAKGLRQEQLDELPLMQEEALQIVEAFCEWLPIEDWEVVTHPETGAPLVEYEVRVPLASGVGSFLGYIDCVLRHKETGAIVVADFKSKKTLGSEGDEDFVTQLPMYIAALKKLGIVATNTFVLFEIKSATPKRAPRKVRVDNESVHNVRESVDGCFRYVPRYCSDIYIESIWQSFEKQCLSMSRFTPAFEYPSRSSFSCKTCEYRALCETQMQGGDVKAVIEAGYEPNPKALAVLQQ